MSYKGTAANERPNIIKKIPAKIIGVSVFFWIIIVCQKLPHYRE
jgi:hypothetical protein